MRAVSLSLAEIFRPKPEIARFGVVFSFAFTPESIST
jgi:hypothetical protein